MQVGWAPQVRKNITNLLNCLMTEPALSDIVKP